MFDAGSVIARIKADLTEFQAGLQKAQDATKGMADKMKASWSGLNSSIEQHREGIKTIGVAAAAVGAAGTLMLKGWIENAGEAARGNAQLDATIKSMKGNTALTADEVHKLAASLSEQTLVTDDAVVSASNMLLKFSTIHKDTFPKVTESVLDIATAMNNGLTPSADQLSSTAQLLGKALDDPAKATSKLIKFGLEFNDIQQAQIEKMMKSGDVAGAQAMILDEVANKYGGQARAQLEASDGLEQLGKRIGEIGEGLGTILLPAVKKVSEAVSVLVTWFEALSPQTQAIIAYFVVFVTVAASIIAQLAGLALILPALQAGFIALGAVLAWIGLPFFVLIGLITALTLAWTTNLWGIQEQTRDFFLQLQAAVELFKFIWEADWFYVQTIVTTVFDFLLDYFTIYWETLKMLFSVALLLLQGNWSGAWDAMKVWAKTVFDIVGKWAGGFWDGLSSIFKAGGELVGGLWNGFMDGIKSVTLSVWEGVKQTFVDAINWIIGKMNSFINALNSVSGVLGKALGLGKKGLSIGSIPTLAQGGIVTSPTLAMIGEGGEPEAVIPLSKLGNMSAGGVHIHLEGAIYGSIDAAVEMLDEAMRRVRPSLGV